MGTLPSMGGLPSTMEGREEINQLTNCRDDIIPGVEKLCY